MYNNGIQSYKKTNVITADPGKLILMCYEGAIDQLKIAKIKYQEKDYENKCKALLKAIDFIDELLCSLDFDQGQSVAKNLSDLYKYMNRKIILADVNKDISGLDEVIKILSELLSAWEEIINKQQNKTKHESIAYNKDNMKMASNYLSA